MASNIDVKDAASATKTLKTTDNAGVHTPHHNVDSLPATPIGANHIGSVGVDNAAGAAAVNIQDGGNSITVDGAVTVSGNVGVSGNVEVVNDVGNPLPVNGTVTAAAQPGVDIGDVTVNNAAGAAAVNVQDGGNSITVDGTVAVSSLPALVAGTANIGDVDVLTLPALVAGTANIGDVDIASFAAGAITEVQGDVAHDAAVGGNPVLGGAEARTTDGTAVASGDAVRCIADTLGKQVVLQGAVHDRQVNGTANYTGTAAADVIAAAGAGVRIAVCSVLVVNAHATVGTKVEIRDGTTVKILALAAAAGGGFSLAAGGRALFISTANTAVTARCVTTGADVDVSISGYTIAN